MRVLIEYGYFHGEKFSEEVTVETAEELEAHLPSQYRDYEYTRIFPEMGECIYLGLQDATDLMVTGLGDQEIAPETISVSGIPFTFRKVKGSLVAETFVTQREWETIMGYSPLLQIMSTEEYGKNPIYFRMLEPDAPVTFISLEEVRTFISKLNELTNYQYKFRLPEFFEYAHILKDGEEDFPVFRPIQNTEPVSLNVAFEYCNHGYGKGSVYGVGGSVWEHVNELPYPVQDSPKSKLGFRLMNNIMPMLNTGYLAGGKGISPWQVVPYSEPNIRYFHIGFRLAAK